MIKLFLRFSFGSWLAAAISLLTIPIVTALIVPDEFGKAAMYSLAFNVLIQVALLGCDQSFARRFYSSRAPGEAAKLLFNSFALPVILALAISACILLFADPISQLVVGHTSAPLIWLLAASVPLGVLERFAMLVLRMNKDATAFSVFRLLASVANFLVVIAYCTFLPATFLAIVVGNVAGLAVCVLGPFIRTRRMWRVKGLDKALLSDLLKYGLPFLPTFLTAWVFEGVDRMMLRQYSTFEEIGLFSAALKLVMVLSIVQTAFSTFWVPISYELYESKSDEAEKTYGMVFSFMSILLFSGGLSLILFKDALMLLLDAQYHSAATILPFLLLVPIMYALSDIASAGINLSNKTYLHLPIAIACAGMNLLLCWWLVPTLEAKGAAISTGLSYIVFFFLRTATANRVCEVKMKVGKASFSILVFGTVALTNTFFSSHPASYASAGCGIVLLLLLHRKEIISFIPVIRRRHTTGAHSH